MPHRRFRAARRSRSRAPSIGTDARHRCRAGLPRTCCSAHACSPSTLATRSDPPCRHARAADPCWSTRPPPPLRANEATYDKMPLTDFCNRPSTRAPTETAGFPARAPRGAVCVGGASVDADLQLRKGSRRSPVGGCPDPSEKRSAVPLRRFPCGGLVGPAWARCPSSDAPCRSPAPPA
jgi:hypothetical protein